MYRREYAFSDVIAVTNRKLCAAEQTMTSEDGSAWKDRFLAQIRRICAVHPAALLLREKDLAPEEYMALAGEVLAVCAEYNVDCILHSCPEAAEYTGNYKLHLPISGLRALKTEGTAGTVGTHAAYDMLGCSVHSVEEALEAQALGATYLVAGHIYATDCKRGVPPRGTSFLREVCAAVSLPVYAIGGIHLEGKTGALDMPQPCKQQMQEIFTCGAKGACIMSGMMRL